MAGHVSLAMLSRYSHVRMEAKQRALDEIAARQRAADQKRQEKAAQKQTVVVSQVAVVQQSPLAVTNCGPQNRPDYRRCPPPPADRLPEDPEFPPE